MLAQEWSEKNAELIHKLSYEIQLFQNTSDCLTDTEFSWSEMFWN